MSLYQHIKMDVQTFGEDYRVAKLSPWYLTLSEIPMPHLMKSIVQL